jgi:hypothetical protein
MTHMTWHIWHDTYDMIDMNDTYDMMWMKWYNTNDMTQMIWWHEWMTCRVEEKWGKRIDLGWNMSFEINKKLFWVVFVFCGSCRVNCNISWYGALTKNTFLFRSLNVCHSLYLIWHEWYDTSNMTWVIWHKWYDIIQHNTTCCNMTWLTWQDQHDMTWHDMTWHDMTNMTWYDMIWHDMTW